MAQARKQLSAAELKELKWDVNEYIKYGKENALNQQWMKELENASAKYHISRLEALKLRTQQAFEVAFGNELDEIDSMARKVFTEDYHHTIYEVQKGFNIGWEVGQIDERKLEKLISKPWAADGKNFSDRVWQQKTQLVNELHTQLTRTCILGKAPDDAIKAISKKFGVTKNQAGRLVMTEQAYFHSVAQQEAFNDLDVEEFEIVATLDSHTSEICQEMDGKHFPMKDYQPGVTAPPFHVWCRSVTVPYFEDNFTGERAARGSDGKTYYVPDNMTYKDWKKSMVDGKTDDLTTVSSNDTIKVTKNAPIQVGGVQCNVTNEQYVFNDGTGNSSRPPQKAIVYETPDGTKFVFPEKYDGKNQTMTPDDAISCWQKVPQEIRSKAQKTVEFVDYYNPQDSYWKKRYKSFTHSYATGGDVITFYKYTNQHDLNYVVRTYCHEAGHFIDTNLGTSGTRYSSTKPWVDAMKADKRISQMKSPTKYGENANVEDFAESMAEFIKDMTAFEKKFPSRAALLRKILGI
jgi:SPP1 gp7 family putative phage head morphogenesis protein